METAGEELSRLRAENACLKQLMTRKSSARLAQSCVLFVSMYAVIAGKVSLTVNKAVRWLNSFNLVQVLDVSLGATREAALANEQRQCGSATALDRDDVLDHCGTYSAMWAAVITSM
jgi:hypothetical protein